MVQSELLIYAACSLRCLGFIISLPFGEALQNLSRIALAVGLGVSISPVAIVAIDLSPLSLLFEFFIGFSLGAPLRFLGDVSEMIGELIDTARGQTISAVLDPLHGQGGSDMSVINKHAAIALALNFGALDMSVQGLARSVSVIPVGTSVMHQWYVGGLIKCLEFLFVEAMCISAVWMGGFLIIDLGSALAGRLISGLSFIQLGSLTKLFVTVVLLILLLEQGGDLSAYRLSEIFVPWRELRQEAGR